MPNIIALDTSTDGCSCALQKGDQIIERFEIAPRRHSELILSQVDGLLAEAGLKLHELDAIAFGCGPGSFMGVRLATGVAQGLSFSANLPVIPVSSLQSLAQRACLKLNQNHIVAAWDARMGEIYWGAYIRDANGIMQPLDQDHLSVPAEIKLPTNQPWVLAGNAWNVYQAELPANLQLESHLFYPRASSMLLIAEQALAQGKAKSAVAVEPNYMRMQVASKKVK